MYNNWILRSERNNCLATLNANKYVHNTTWSSQTRSSQGMVHRWVYNCRVWGRKPPSKRKNEKCKKKKYGRRVYHLDKKSSRKKWMTPVSADSTWSDWDHAIGLLVLYIGGFSCNAYTSLLHAGFYLEKSSGRYCGRNHVTSGSHLRHACDQKHIIFQTVHRHCALLLAYVGRQGIQITDAPPEFLLRVFPNRMFSMRRIWHLLILSPIAGARTRNVRVIRKAYSINCRIILLSQLPG